MAREFQPDAQGKTVACAARWAVVFLVITLVAGLASKTVGLPNTSQTVVVQAGPENARPQTFEGSGVEWAVPVAIYAPELWPVEVAQMTAAVQPLISFPFEDSLYIRPPPLQS